ncbi:sigma-70 family RNA polymerase sigma factor [Pseudomonas tructae]|uniref:RNA polymerase sigma factor n=1 Tax=Pseudomonas tructae TaxID=2518644 RepID=A0A411MEW8_9PSED|nr:sigma-70 family RNA polymerase sigma factor [Pseudomonas tructae]QBF25254.1 sigma-70 family RNA polymerase sigma factor [Pseudomonas tructae]
MDTPKSWQRDVEHLYLEYNGWLRNWLRKRLSESADADDLAQDTFLRVMRTHQPLNELRQPLAYLATIANGLLVNRWRRQAVERAYIEALAAQPEAVALSAEDQYLLIETLVEVDALLHGLSPRAREIFLLSQLDGLTYRQIAAQLGLSIDQVQKSMSKAFALCYASQFE